MLENEPSSGADGTAGTTETTDANAARPLTVAAPQTGEVKVSAPAKRSGGIRSAGPPPEPEPVATDSGKPLTTIAGDVEAEPEPEVSESTDAEGAKGGERTRVAKAPRARVRTAGTENGPEDEPAAEESAPAERDRAAGGSTAESAPVFEDAREEAPESSESGVSGAFQPPMVLFQPPVAQAAASGPADGIGEEPAAVTSAEEEDYADGDESSDDERPSRRRRRRGGRGRGKSRTGEESAEATTADHAVEDDSSTEQAAEPAGEAAMEETAASSGDTDEDEGEQSRGSRRRRRRRRRSGGEAAEPASEGDDPPNTIVKVREPRQEKPIEDEVQSVKGSTRLEAKKQRRREGREQGRRRTPIITESEFLARRESVQRDLVIRRVGERTQIAVLEDDVLVEHYVDRATHKSYVGNVYLGRVQNVLPSMEAAFVDIGKGRNAVLYAGEVNWDASGLEGQPKRIESVLKSGQSVLVQVTKDPLGHKGARLTSQISLPGRYLVYVPDGSMTGISRKLPDKERARLKQILKKVMPENAGVIVRTAAEGASEEELERDISRLASQWESIKRKSKSASAPSLLSSEPDLTVRVVRDVFNEDFASLVVSGEEAWSTVREYVDYVAPHLAERLTNWDGDRDVFEAYRVDEQIAKALERKVWLPSGGSLIIERTEAMTVIDVNTGKFTGQGGNLEETVTKNNLEAAEEIVRQLRLRDIGGIIVIDFIDMVLESNRDLVLRRMLECLSRDRTKHQVAEVTSLGLVQMTRKRVGQGLLEAFSHTCESCNGRGVVLSTEPVDSKSGTGGGAGAGANGRKKKAKSGSDKNGRSGKSDSGDAVDKAEESAAEERSGGAAGPGGKETAAQDAAPPSEAAPAEAGTAAKGAKGTKAATKKTAAKKSTRKTKKDGEAAEPAAGDAAESAPSDEAGGTGDAETAAERPRRRRTRRSKTSGVASESASAVVEAG
ncbi:Rne/Rng family ribonuclease [Allosalinactinospora lopnorensis]|uniref:Rne/Rng family ribonuclease n=1 Tax=Allosalinactinospora lopnorensis TaxID=1352348 RepID=UPI000623EB1E|nr:Rne/Rng family ribonuclease [Allosalinactinospora lopnorensis]